MDLDLSALTPAEVYATMTQVIVPRPVAWVLSEDDAGGLNLAPYSYFTAVSSDPPTIVLSIGRKPGGGEIKDTRVNLEARGDCVVHIAHGELAASVTASAATLAHGHSEVTALGLETCPMPGSRLPRLALCRIALACTHVETHEIGRQGIVFARVHHVHIDDAVMGEDDKGRPKALGERIEPLGRLGGGDYLVGGEVISIARPD